MMSDDKNKAPPPVIKSTAIGWLAVVIGVVAFFAIAETARRMLLE
ncbi:MAG: hypothetical protein R3D70_00490 [Rhizobiaceae bacterium]